jgi:GxxExxY protein
MDSDKCESITEVVLAAVFEVSNTLGPGFLERVYERALLLELKLRGLSAEAQVRLSISYKGENVGDYFADILVEGQVVLELKCVERLVNEHMAQCMHYLIASGRNVCLLINFQKATVEWRRIVVRS